MAWTVTAGGSLVTSQRFRSGSNSRVTRWRRVAVIAVLAGPMTTPSANTVPGTAVPVTEFDCRDGDLDLAVQRNRPGTDRGGHGCQLPPRRRVGHAGDLLDDRPGCPESGEPAQAAEGPRSGHEDLGFAGGGGVAQQVGGLGAAEGARYDHRPVAAPAVIAADEADGTFIDRVELSLPGQWVVEEQVGSGGRSEIPGDDGPPGGPPAVVGAKRRQVAAGGYGEEIPDASGAAITEQVSAAVAAERARDDR